MYREEVDTLRTKRQQISESLHRYEELNDGVDLSELEACYEDSQPLLNKLWEIHSEIEILDASEFSNRRTRHDYNKRYFATIQWSESIAKQAATNEQLQSSNDNTPTHSQNDYVSLPKIDLRVNYRCAKVMCKFELFSFWWG